MHGGRRQFLTATALALPVLLYGAANPTAAPPGRMAGLRSAFRQLERDNGGRLGVAVLDTGTGERTGYRHDERFPMCSTFKFLLAAAVMRKVDRHKESLDRRLPIPPKPLLSHSPLTEPNAGATMSIDTLCHAALTQSDNTAANALLATIGGPQGITQFCRSLGDRMTRLDRWELDLNESLEGDPRDTTTPAAMVLNLRSVLLGDVLSPGSRRQLRAWMEACATGTDRLRAKLPPGWTAADKTGANGEHTSNDIAVFWPPTGGHPLVIAAYLTQCQGPEAKRAAVLAEIGRLIVS